MHAPHDTTAPTGPATLATHVFDGAPLGVGTIAALSGAPVRGESSPDCWQRVARGREIVERTLTAGVPVYGAAFEERVVYEALLPLLPLLHIGAEGRRIFDMAAIVARVRYGDLLERAFASVPAGS